MEQPYDLSVVLLHDDMIDKQGRLVTTSLTLIDLHDIARSSKTYGLKSFFISHSSPTMRKLAGIVQSHWQDGFGAAYNPKRQQALSLVAVLPSLDEVIKAIEQRTGKRPKLLATSAKDGERRVSFQKLRQELDTSSEPYLLMLGTGWGMSEELLARADVFLEPLKGLPTFNHLSVRSAAAIMFDRLLGLHAERA
jgi:hypothetical protein